MTATMTRRNSKPSTDTGVANTLPDEVAVVVPSDWRYPLIKMVERETHGACLPTGVTIDHVRELLDQLHATALHARDGSGYATWTLRVGEVESGIHVFMDEVMPDDTPSRAGTFHEAVEKALSVMLGGRVKVLHTWLDDCKVKCHFARVTVRG